MRRTVWGIVPILALLVSLAGASSASAQPVGKLGIHAFNCETNPPEDATGRPAPESARDDERQEWRKPCLGMSTIDHDANGDT